MECPEHSSYALAGRRFVVLAERDFLRLCRAAGVEADAAPILEPEPLPLLDQGRLRERIRDRRQSAGLTQAELARRAGIRVETLNRIERGRNSPDFSTIRKLVVALRRPTTP